MSSGSPTPAPPPPRAQDLLAVDPDAWATLLAPIRRGLHELDDALVTPEVQRLRASPASRLAGGRMRQELAALLARGGPAWEAVHAALAAAELPSSLAWLESGETPAAPAPRRRRPEPTRSRDDEELRRARERGRELRRDLDEARRQLAGAEARADAAEARVAELTDDVAAERAARQELEAELAALREDQGRVVERERRRGERRIAELERELQAVRREHEAERDERARVARAREAAEDRAKEQAATAERRRREPGARVRPGRPTVLPKGIRPDTREEAEALLGPGRLVLVDGYNVTLNRKAHLSLEEQREWLVRLLGGLVARRRVRARVVFDGRGGGGAERPGAARGVTVVFTPSGVTADDEIALAVQATDEPIVVVTDDRELRDRVRPHGADLLRTEPFLWAAG